MILVEGVNQLTVSLVPIPPPVAIAGEISHIWMWHEPLTSWGMVWAPVGPGPDVGPGVPLNGDIYISPFWRNTSGVSIVGHLDLVVTFPDGTKISPAATANQDKEAEPGDGWAVSFYSAFIATQEGNYTVVATLSSGGQVLDSVTFALVVEI